MKPRIGLLTIGQSPRPDMTADLLPLLGDAADFSEAGALDGLTKEEILSMAPADGEDRLVTRLRSGETVVLADRLVPALLQKKITSLEREGVSLIVLLCTGTFPPFESRVPVLYPWSVLKGTVPAAAGRSRAAIVIPSAEQVPAWRRRWGALLDFAEVLVIDPYTAEGTEAAARQIRTLDVDVVVLDCMGYPEELRRKLRTLTERPVILARSLLARVVLELL